MTTGWLRLCAVLLLIAVVLLSFTAGVLTGGALNADGDCLRPVERWSPAKQRWALRLAEDTLAEGGTGPAPGTCQAERLEWLRDRR